MYNDVIFYSTFIYVTTLYNKVLNNDSILIFFYDFNKELHAFDNYIL